MSTYERIFAHMAEDDGPLSFPLLTTANDTVKFFDLAKAPHALWAGTTGSGKSVSLNVAVATMIKRNDDRIIFDMIDPKRVELSIYRNVENVRSVTTNMDEAAQVVEALAEEMDERYALLEREGVRKLDDYNAKTGADLPYRVLVVDELADLMDTHKAQVLPALVRIGQLGRAAGFHMMLATQRPAADTIPKKLLANVPARIALLCQSHTESRLILGEKGAEDLNGHGDMLVQVPGEKGFSRGVGPFLSDEELGEIVLAHTDPALEDPTDEELDEEIEELGAELEEEEVPEPEEVIDTEAVQTLSRLLAEAMHQRAAGSDSELYERIVVLEREVASLTAENAGLNDEIMTQAQEVERLGGAIAVAEKRAEVAEEDQRKGDRLAQRAAERTAEAEKRTAELAKSWRGRTLKVVRIAALIMVGLALLAAFTPAGVSVPAMLSVALIAPVVASSIIREEGNGPDQRVQSHFRE